MYTNVTVGFRESYCLSGFYEYLSLNSIGSSISHYLLNMPLCGTIIDILINNKAANPKLVKVAAHKSEGFKKFAQTEILVIFGNGKVKTVMVKHLESCYTI